MRTKIFAVMMAVICVMSVMCMTAFAAEMPPGSTLLTNGQSISTDLLTSLDSPYVIAADGVETISIKGLFGFSWIYGWNGTDWVRIEVPDATDVTITCADYPQYSYYTAMRRDTSTSQMVTVSWTEPSMLDDIGTVSGALWSSAKDAANFVIRNPLAMITVFVGLVAIGVLLGKRFLFAH